MRNLFHPFLFLYCTVLLVSCDAQESQQIVQDLHVFKSDGKGWRTILYVNGNPVFANTLAESRGVGLQPWLRKGKNEITIEIEIDA